MTHCEECSGDNAEEVGAFVADEMSRSTGGRGGG